MLFVESGWLRVLPADALQGGAALARLAPPFTLAPSEAGVTAPGCEKKPHERTHLGDTRVGA